MHPVFVKQKILTFLIFLIMPLAGAAPEEKFAKAISPMRSQGLRRFDANLASEKSAHQSDFSLFPPFLKRMHTASFPGVQHFVLYSDRKWCPRPAA
jgi:hypothetical protein